MSPAREKTSFVPIEILLEIRYPILLALALVTDLPSVITGLVTTTGVYSPDLPRFHSMSITSVSSRIGINLIATQSEGLCCVRLFILLDTTGFMTIPSRANLHVSLYFENLL